MKSVIHQSMTRMAMAGIMASMISASLAQTPRDLTTAGAIAALKADSSTNPSYNETYSLGPTGLRGWIDLGPRGIDEYGGADVRASN
jgi:hypothetical protein